jgi:hypothetical protein
LIGGAEYVVTEKSSGETLCVLCKAQLKDALTIIDHLRSQKHINSFVVRISHTMLNYYKTGILVDKALSRNLSRYPAQSQVKRRNTADAGQVHGRSGS